MPDATQIQAMLDGLNTELFGADSRITLRYVALTDLHEQDVNANVMPQGMFNALVANVERHAVLESVPLCATRAETPDRIEIVSGHHRTRAARAAGLSHVLVLVYAGLTDSEIKAKQLAHNAIQGQSDPEIIKRIFSSIQTVEAKMETYIDPATFEALPKTVPFQQVDVNPEREAKTVLLLFLPTQLEDFHDALTKVEARVDRVYVADRKDFDAFKDALHRTRTDLEIYSYPTAVVEMARLAVERLQQLHETILRAQADGKIMGTTIIDEEAAEAL